MTRCRSRLYLSVRGPDDAKKLVARCESDHDGHRIHEGAIMMGTLKGRLIDWSRTQRGHAIRNAKDRDAYGETKAWFLATFVWNTEKEEWSEGITRRVWPEGVLLEKAFAGDVTIVCGRCRTQDWHKDGAWAEKVADAHRKDHERWDRQAKEREERLKRHPEVAK